MEYLYSFEKLNVWSESKQLVIEVYKLLKDFPKEERYGLCDQLRRAIVSVPSNIAEGCGRLSAKEQAHFMEIAYGSLMESYCQIQIAVDLGYVSQEDYLNIRSKILSVSKLLTGFRNSIIAKANV